VTEVWVKNNTLVEVGQKLFQIDTSQYEIALDQAKSNLETTQRQVDAGGAAVRSARANLVAAQANEEKAQKDYTRLKRLRANDEGTISQRRLEVSEATLEQAKAGVVSAEAAVDQAIEQQGGEVDANNAQLKAARAAVDQAQLDLSNATVRASTSGIITDLQAEIGQYAGTGSPVLTLVALQDVWVRAEYTENNLGHMHAGDKVDILFDVMPGHIFQGKVRSLGIGVSASQASAPGTLPTIDNNRDWLRQAQRFPVMIEFDPNLDATLRGQLRVGGQATVLTYTGENSLLNTLGRFYIKLMSYFSYAY
jgi:multidrug resistance efflux pump